MEYYSAIKKNETMPFAATWMDLEIIILSEVSQRQISYDITYMWNLKYDTNEYMYMLIYSYKISGGIKRNEMIFSGEWKWSSETSTFLHSTLCTI